MMPDWLKLDMLGYCFVGLAIGWLIAGLTFDVLRPGLLSVLAVAFAIGWFMRSLQER